MSEELNCLWCGNPLVSTGKVYLTCDFGPCFLLARALKPESWKKAYCWKEIDSLRQRLVADQKTIDYLRLHVGRQERRILALKDKLEKCKAKQRTEGEGT